MRELIERFVGALDELHYDGNIEPLVQLFGKNASLVRAGMPYGQRGAEGARTFWTEYRNVFDHIDAAFTHTTIDHAIAYLEWTSHGTLVDGTEIDYEGVSVLEATGETIEAFRTYYDTAAFNQRKNAIGGSPSLRTGVGRTAETASP